MKKSPIKTRIKKAKARAKNRAEIESLVWTELPEKVRIELGKVRLRQLIAIVLTEEATQLEFAIDGDRFPVEDIPPDILEKRGLQLIAIGQGCITRGEAYLAEARRRREA